MLLFNIEIKTPFSKRHREGGCGGNDLELYSGGDRFESSAGKLTMLIEVTRGFPRLSSQMTGYYCD
jgi:hypothetical protein